MELIQSTMLSFTINDVNSKSIEQIREQVIKRAEPLVELFMIEVASKYTNTKIEKAYHSFKHNKKKNTREAFVLFNVWR
jgi:hypothetical protein